MMTDLSVAYVNSCATTLFAGLTATAAIYSIMAAASKFKEDIRLRHRDFVHERIAEFTRDFEFIRNSPFGTTLDWMDSLLEQDAIQELCNAAHSGSREYSLDFELVLKKRKSTIRSCFRMKEIAGPSTPSWGRLENLNHQLIRIRPFDPILHSLLTPVVRAIAMMLAKFEDTGRLEDMFIAELRFMYQEPSYHMCEKASEFNAFLRNHMVEKILSRLVALDWEKYFDEIDSYIEAVIEARSVSPPSSTNQVRVSKQAEDLRSKRFITSRVRAHRDDLGDQYQIAGKAGAEVEKIAHLLDLQEAY